MNWIFSYGSLMWQPGFDFVERVRGTLDDYHRAFNKASTVRWGTPDQPAPTLGLEDGGACHGLVYRIKPHKFDEIMTYLRRREGDGFAFPTVSVVLESGQEVDAVVAVNEHDDSYIGGKTIDERAAMALQAEGTAGTGIEYVLNTYEKIRACGIEDRHVREVAERVAALAEDAAEQPVSKKVRNS